MELYKILNNFELHDVRSVVVDFINNYSGLFIIKNLIGTRCNNT